MAAIPSPANKLKSKVPNAVMELVRCESFENARIARDTTVKKTFAKDTNVLQSYKTRYARHKPIFPMEYAR